MMSEKASGRKVSAEYVASQLENSSRAGDGWVASCPHPDHHDANPSFTIREGDNEILYKCHGGCPTEECMKAMRDQGIDIGEAPKKKMGRPKNQKLEQVAVYDYTDENGELIYQVVRYKPKTFRQRVLNQDGSYTWSLKDVEKTYPYRLPEFHSLKRTDEQGLDRAICIFEGEKDADLAHELGILGTTFPNGAGKWRDEWADWFSGRRVYIIPDLDDQGITHAKVLAEKLVHITLKNGLKIVRLPNPKTKRGYDFANYIEDGGTKQTFASLCQSAAPYTKASKLPAAIGDKPAKAAIITADFEQKVKVTEEPYQPSDPVRHWEIISRQLVLKADGTIDTRSIKNSRIFLEHHPDMIGRLAWNVRTNSAWMVKPFPWVTSIHDREPRPLMDVDKIGAIEWLEDNNIKREGNTVVDIMEKIAREYPFDYLTDYLNELEWDGEERIGSMLIEYFGAHDTDLNRVVSSRFMIGAAARAIDPGCKNDSMLILEGAQGIRKSSGLEVLFGKDYFCDQLPSLSKNADAAMQLAGHWCVEVQEMNTMNKADYNRIKEFLSVKVDKYRAPFARHPISVPRSCVVVGTINPETGYLKDPTGARRFWPVFCKDVDTRSIKRDRDQLWAEAVHKYRAGAKWWFDSGDEGSHLLKEEQAERFAFDVWAEDIAVFAAERGEVTTREIATECLRMDIDKVTPVVASRISKTLVALGYVSRRDAKRRFYARPKSKL